MQKIRFQHPKPARDYRAVVPAVYTYKPVFIKKTPRRVLTRHTLPRRPRYDFTRLGGGVSVEMMPRLKANRINSALLRRPSLSITRER